MSVRLVAQAPTTDLSFEAATVKFVDTSQRFSPSHFWVHVYPGRASYWSMSLAAIIAYANRIDSIQVSGPDWLKTERFDIEATFPEGVDKKDERTMLRNLLKDRFKLSFHVEDRQLDGYVLVVGKRGAKLQPSIPDPPSPPSGTSVTSGDSHAGQEPARSNKTRNADGSTTVDLGTRGKQTSKFDPEKSAIHFEQTKMTMEQLAEALRICLGDVDRKIVDETGIKGTYRLTYDCPMPTIEHASADIAAADLPSDPQNESALIHSLNELGLKLEKRRIPQRIYVIDHVEQPAAN